MPDIGRFLGILARDASTRPAWQRYAVALVLPGVAAVITATVVGLQGAPFFPLFTLSIVLVSMFGGMRPGFVAVALDIVLNVLFVPPRMSFSVASPNDLVRIVLFAAVGTTIAAFIGAAGELQAKVELERERLSVTLRSIGDAVIATDSDGRVTFMNAVAEAATGWMGSDAAGHPLEEVFQIVNETTRATVDNPVRRVLMEGRVVGLANHTILLRKDGSELPIDDSAAPIRSAAGIEGVILVFRDITQAKLSQAALVQAEKLATVGRLAATIAHEINNPLEAVSNLLFLAASDQALSTQSREYLDVAQTELDRAAQLCRQTLSFHHSSPEKSAVNVREAVDLVFRLYSSRAAGRGINLENKIDEHLNVWMVPSQLRQIISNLVSNAIDAMAGGGTFCASGQSDGAATVQLAFRDTGKGIPRPQLDRVFDAFFTTKPDTGTGLGLWVTKGIVENHDGTIAVESSTEPESSGTVFTVVLPAAENIAASQAVSAE